jgi:hypothetical protein
MWQTLIQYHKFVVIVQTSSILLHLLAAGIPVDPPSPAIGHDSRRAGDISEKSEKREQIGEG